MSDRPSKERLESIYSSYDHIIKVRAECTLGPMPGRPYEDDVRDLRIEILALTKERNTLRAENKQLWEACRAAADLYDKMAIDTDRLGCAAKYGPDYSPPTRDEWNKMCLEVRSMLQEATQQEQGDGED